MAGGGPATNSGGAISSLTRLLMQGIQRASNAKPRVTRKPITMQLLICFVDAIRHLDRTIIEKARLKALILLSFWGFFRASELCMMTSEENFLRHKDISFNQTTDGYAYLFLIQ